MHLSRFLAGWLLVCALPAAAAPAAEHPAVGAGVPCSAPGCHAGIAQSVAGGSGHDPAAAGDCGGCHDLALATAAFAREVPGESDAALCAPCHAAHAASATDASVRTGFAEEDRDLHALHVRAAGRGRVCLTCHDPHAGPQPRLLRTEVSVRGSLRITQHFEELPGGGRCTTRCHAPKTYRRDGR